MGSKDRRVDAYIAKSPPFARPILTRLRGIVHEACPTVEETLKWGHPAFVYHGLMCGMATFKAHATLGFWKGSLIGLAGTEGAEQAWGNFGRITKVSELPAKKTIVGFVKKAMKLNEDGVTVARPKANKKPVAMPAYFRAALAKNRTALKNFGAFPPGKRRDYVEWLAEAKQAGTRERRLATAIEWIAEGKARNWKYER